MAAVWRIRHQQLGCDRALKVALTPQEDRRLQLEGRLQAQLRHPALISVLDMGEVEGRMALVLELVEGPSLARWMQDGGPVPSGTACRLVRQLAEGVAYVHRQGIVHRDITPRNVLLDPRDGLLLPRLVDFGIALVRARPERPEEGCYGSPRYMAPEQLSDFGGVDQRADVFSLGCLLYELLVGHPAFPQTRTSRILAAVHAGAYAPLPIWVGPEVRRILRRCLAVDPRARFPDAGSLCEALSALPEPSVGTSLEDAEMEPTSIGLPPVRPPPEPAGDRSPVPPPPSSHTAITGLRALFVVLSCLALGAGITLGTLLLLRPNL
ncbi:MAG: serine/threonine protein kinase [Alphaproteobacteria bacterium]|nr:serine/threonine protein kinase [Alphaproteobacteria bacterium]